MNYSAEERIKILNGNCWSRDEVRRLIRDCEELETKSQGGQVQLEQRVRAQKDEIVKVLQSHNNYATLHIIDNVITDGITHRDTIKRAEKLIDFLSP